jgi:hypothetical protein
MIKGLGKLVTARVKLGKPFALNAAEEEVENSGMPGADIALDIAKLYLPNWMAARKNRKVEL